MRLWSWPPALISLASRMESVVVNRIGGRVFLLRERFGIIVGDNGVHHMFLPTEVGGGTRFDQLRLTQPVQFEPFEFHDPATNEYKGWRARRVTSFTRLTISSI